MVFSASFLNRQNCTCPAKPAARLGSTALGLSDCFHTQLMVLRRSLRPQSRVPGCRILHIPCRHLGAIPCRLGKRDSGRCRFSETGGRSRFSTRVHPSLLSSSVSSKSVGCDKQ